MLGSKAMKELSVQIKESKSQTLTGIIGGPPCPDFSVAGRNKGKDGENGKDGEAGKDGTSIVWKGSFDSEDKLKNPQYLWAYFNTKDGCSYIYDGKEWTLIMNTLCFVKADGTNLSKPS